PPPPWRGDESSVVHHCLGGYLRRATLCDCCGHVSMSHEGVLGLEVHLGPRVGSVEEGLRGYFEDEVLDESNQYRCERCRQLVCATRRVRLEVAPNVLAITLKRFTTRGIRAAKDTRKISLRLQLDLAPYLAPGSLDPGPAAYRLYAVVQHLGLLPPGALPPSAGLPSSPPGGSGGGSGSLNMGHYVAVVRGGDGSWYYCDDDEVTQISESEVAGITDAYMLFYERIEPRVTRPQPPSQTTAQQPEEEEEEEAVAAEANGALSGTEEDKEEVVKGSKTDRANGGARPPTPPTPPGCDSPAPAAAVAAASAHLQAAAVRQQPLHLPNPEAPGWSRWLEPDSAPPAPPPPQPASKQQQQPHATAAAAGGGGGSGKAAGKAGGKFAKTKGASTTTHPPPAAAASPTAAEEVERVAVRPHFELLPPSLAAKAAAASAAASGTASAASSGEWTLRVRLPGVRSARDIKMAATSAPAAAALYADAERGEQPQQEGAVGGLMRAAGRVRVWVTGSYSLDLRLGLRERRGDL
ncbi:hypothetical protein Agub_g4250, partial [Astrephomene gubernaculifera]